MLQGAAGASAWFASVMQLTTGDLDDIQMYLHDAMRSDDSPITHVATTIKLPHWLGGPYQGSSNYSGAYSMVSTITARSCLIWPNAYAQLRPYSRKEPHSALLPLWKRPFAPSSWNWWLHRYLSSPIGTLLSISFDHFALIVVPAPMASEQRSNRNSLTTLSAQSSILVKQL